MVIACLAASESDSCTVTQILRVLMDIRITSHMDVNLLYIVIRFEIFHGSEYSVFMMWFYVL